jgi:hypothetical protein
MRSGGPLIWCPKLGSMLNLHIPVYTVRGQMWSTGPVPTKTRANQYKDHIFVTSISRLEKATWKIGTGAPPRIAVHQSADSPPFARDARSKHVWVWECSSRPQGCLLADTVPVVIAPARS